MGSRYISTKKNRTWKMERQINKEASRTPRFCISNLILVSFLQGLRWIQTSFQKTTGVQLGHELCLWGNRRSWFLNCKLTSQWDKYQKFIPLLVLLILVQSSHTQTLTIYIVTDTFPYGKKKQTTPHIHTHNLFVTTQKYQLRFSEVTSDSGCKMSDVQVVNIQPVP